MEHYLDNSATTRVCGAAADKALWMMTECYGNPSSLHRRGIDAEHELSYARKTVAGCLGAAPEELTFTSGGTEANNLALFGAAYANRRRGNRLVISAVEHSSVLEAAKRLSDEGFEVIEVEPDRNGVITAEAVAGAVNDKTLLVSVMTVNNETGAIMPVRDIFDAARDINPSVLCHTDAVQAFGKLGLRMKRLGADLVSVSGHKVHAPKGVGALAVRRGVRLIPRQFGGEQERRLRPGTEAAPLIAAFGAACSEFDTENNIVYVKELNSYAREGLALIEGVTFNSPGEALPYVLNFSAGSVRSETMLHFLEERGIYVSSGSACAKGKPSHVLAAMGLSRDRADSALRVSFSKYNTKEDIDALCGAVARGLEVLAHR